MSPRVFLWSLVAALPSPAAHAAPEDALPNILILVADDMGYADLGVQGCTDIPTPNIDSIATTGVRFTSGYVSAPVCSPCRARLLTERHQTRFGHELNHPLADRAKARGQHPLVRRGEPTLRFDRFSRFERTRAHSSPAALLTQFHV